MFGLTLPAAACVRALYSGRLPVSSDVFFKHVGAAAAEAPLSQPSLKSDAPPLPSYLSPLHKVRRESLVRRLEQSRPNKGLQIVSFGAKLTLEASSPERLRTHRQ